jgi:hypothetical protein
MQFFECRQRSQVLQIRIRYISVLEVNFDDWYGEEAPLADHSAAKFLDGLHGLIFGVAGAERRGRQQSANGYRKETARHGCSLLK